MGLKLLQIFQTNGLYSELSIPAMALNLCKDTYLITSIDNSSFL